MTAHIRSLLATYDFVQSALVEHGADLAAEEAAKFQNRLEQLFLDIVEHQSDEPRITITQLRFLLTQLVNQCTKQDATNALRELCERHLNTLAAQIRHASPPKSEPVCTEHRYLDSLTDRVSILDRKCRYVFTNKANAAFHGEDAADFVGRPIWFVTGRRFFENHVKPHLDACFEGEPQTYISAHPTVAPSRLHLVNIDPVSGKCETPQQIMLTCKDVSSLPIPENLIAKRD